MKEMADRVSREIMQKVFTREELMTLDSDAAAITAAYAALIAASAQAEDYPETKTKELLMEITEAGCKAKLAIRRRTAGMGSDGNEYRITERCSKKLLSGQTVAGLCAKKGTAIHAGLSRC